MSECSTCQGLQCLTCLVRYIEIRQTACTLKRFLAVGRRMQILRTFSKVAVAELEQKTCLKFFRGGMGDRSGSSNSVTGVDLCDV